jgi:hypothetical protein
MPDRKKVAPKSYLSKYPAFSCSFMVDDGDGGKVSDTIRFVAGEYTTDFEDEQKHLDAMAFVTAKPSPRVALVASATALGAAAVKAKAAAKDAEDALAAFDKPVAAPSK